VTVCDGERNEAAAQKEEVDGDNDLDEGFLVACRGEGAEEKGEQGTTPVIVQQPEIILNERLLELEEPNCEAEHNVRTIEDVIVS